MATVRSKALTTSLSPLPDVLRRGLVAVSFFGILSLVSSSCLFIFLTYKLTRWYWKGQLRNGANQFLILIYNLLLADIQQAIAFSLPVAYIAKDEIRVGSDICFTNGWMVSTGDLASGVFIFSIALHTFLAVIKGRSLSNKIFYAWIAFAWGFIYAMAIVTVTIHDGVYVRAGAWCWIDSKYKNERLWLHYFWIFVCMFGTVIIYALIFMSLRTRSRSFDQNTMRSTDSDPIVLKRAAKYMVIYPIVYVICTLPLAGGRMAAMTGMDIPYWWYCLAGAAITSCGWLDVVLYAMTRRVLIFSHMPPPRNDFGFDTLGWKHGGQGFWGTTTTIEGPISNRRKKSNIFGRNTSRTLRERDSEEENLAAPPDGVVSVKTTVDVIHSPMPIAYEESDFSIIEMEDKTDRGHTPAQTPTRGSFRSSRNQLQHQ